LLAYFKPETRCKLITDPEILQNAGAFEAMARSLGYQRETINDLLTFHMVFGKTVNDVSLNAVANLGYAAVRFLEPVYPGDTLRLQHTITESRPLRKRLDTGLVLSVWEVFNQNGEKVLQMEGYGMFGRRHPATAEEIARLEATLPKA